MINLINIILPRSLLLKSQCFLIKSYSAILDFTKNYRSSFTSLIAPTAKLPTKLTLTASMNTNSSLALKLNTYQNLAYVDTTNLANQLDSGLDRNSKKTNIIVTYSNIEKH